MAEETAKAEAAERVAALKARTDEALAAAELERARQACEKLKREGREDAPRTDDDPREFQQALKTQRKRDDIARAARKREAAILAKVGGDETLLDDEEEEKRS